MLEVYKEFIQLDNKTHTQVFKKWASEVNRHFPEEDFRMAEKVHELMLAANHGETWPQASWSDCQEGR